jgi:hypothetical protein
MQRIRELAAELKRLVDAQVGPPRVTSSDEQPKLGEIWCESDDSATYIVTEGGFVDLKKGYFYKSDCWNGAEYRVAPSLKAFLTDEVEL